VKVSLSISGGLAAGLRLGRPPTVVDGSGLSGTEAGELAGLLSAVRGEAPPAQPAARVPDEASYTVTVEDDGAPVVLRRSDTTMSQAFADLLSWLEAHGSPEAL